MNQHFGSFERFFPAIGKSLGIIAIGAIIYLFGLKESAAYFVLYGAPLACFLVSISCAVGIWISVRNKQTENAYIYGLACLIGIVVAYQLFGHLPK